MTLIHHVVRGAGAPPVVFVHGFACAHTDWAAQTAHLAPRHRTVAVDLRGHGASPGTPDECSIERYGADVAEVMRALDLPSAVLVGHSKLLAITQFSLHLLQMLADMAVAVNYL